MKPNTDLIPQLVSRGWTPIARIRPRTAREIGDSPWSIGLETIDRAYVDFAPLSPYVGELGATQARIQAGWARCEPKPGGGYDWAWLDEIVDGCLSCGVRPWLQTAYGNPAYPGGGGIGLAEGLPTSEEALLAWDRWIGAMTDRYHGKVDTWEIWNEPDIAKIPPEDYAAFYLRTARVIRNADPKARLVALALALHDERNYAGKFLQFISERGGLPLIDEISFHFYPHNPDDTFATVRSLQRLCARYDSRITLRQGETGSPSECSRFLALGRFDWTERKQAAWNIRRLLAHHARAIPMNLFQIADMHYEKKHGSLHAGRNPKGQLCIAPDKTVAYKKPAWFAAQHVFSVFDNTFAPAPATALDMRRCETTAAWVWTRHGTAKSSFVAWWQADAPPSMTTPDLQVGGLEPLPLRDPVLVDFMSGVVFAPAPGIAAGDVTAWDSLPLAETPLALAEKDELPLNEF
ncbi:hypothetical protein Ga0100231_017030 [Opitutaceae bacterium TAV4]|nr:hypothetical protein Ga0100231_017030 [Opitutaceae bacterium TAV4]RRJ99698.1 hypothetical protein Ga0100230_016575 [Opitutaceae bacterium TAV3]